MPDLILVCRDCGQDFIFTSGEQEFFAAHEFPDPVRCQPCREEHKEVMRQRRELALSRAKKAVPAAG